MTLHYITIHYATLHYITLHLSGFAHSARPNYEYEKHWLKCTRFWWQIVMIFIDVAATHGRLLCFGMSALLFGLHCWRPLGLGGALWCVCLASVWARRGTWRRIGARQQNGWWHTTCEDRCECEHVDISKVSIILLKHAYTNGLKSCTRMLWGLERHNWKCLVFQWF